MAVKSKPARFAAGVDFGEGYGQIAARLGSLARKF
jgi:hypothetical protein